MKERSFVRNQHKQQFGNFGSQGNASAVTHQNTLLGIPAKGTKRIEVACLHAHPSAQILSQISYVDEDAF